MLGCTTVSLIRVLIGIYFDREPLSVSVGLLFYFPVQSIVIFIVVWPICVISKMILSDAPSSIASDESKD